jgi:hypothetical protein
MDGGFPEFDSIIRTDITHRFRIIRHVEVLRRLADEEMERNGHIIQLIPVTEWLVIIS